MPPDDQKLAQTGGMIRDLKQLDLSVGLGVTVCEYPTDTGPTDHVLFVNRQAVGVIEAKKNAACDTLTATEKQTERYAIAHPKWRTADESLQFF